MALRLTYYILVCLCQSVRVCLAANDKAAAEAALKDATSAIASAGSKGIFHKNNAARKVSRLTKLVNGLA